MKPRFFWIALILIGISWISNSIYAHSKQLDKPIFLDHYIDVELQDYIYITFYYLTNKNDSSVVSSVSTGELIGYPEDPYFADEGIQNRQSFNNHVLRSVNVRFDLEQPSVPEIYSFTEMDIFFSNGKKITTPIGIVNIFPYFNERIPLEQVSTMMGSNYNNADYRATEPLTVDTIKGSYQEVLQDNFLIKINSPSNPTVSQTTEKEFLDPMEKEWRKLPGLDLKNVQLPFDLKNGERLSVYSSISKNLKAVFDLSIHISGKSESGRVFSTTVRFNHQPYLEQKDVNAIIKEKTRGDTNG
ncbi:hypothetical protein [Sporosarcina psychrophila]|uniref:hypothetical protein n=1 Tax=Sporosarcina psychrophila TaxID=1476 RepID=UPI00078CAD0B|nr:hypothetical protein [Sporosarcina psychrophila]AMQ08149.1 hypothetical protein AZE41_20645 [Sporosarcina psychrophila]